MSPSSSEPERPHRQGGEIYIENSLCSAGSVVQFSIKKAAVQGLPRLSKHIQNCYGINTCAQPPRSPWWRNNNSRKMNRTASSLLPLDCNSHQSVTLDYTVGKVKLLFSVHGPWQFTHNYAKLAYLARLWASSFASGHHCSRGDWQWAIRSSIR